MLAIVPSTLSGLLCALAIGSRAPLLLFNDAIVIVVITIATTTIGIAFVDLLLLVTLIP
jgi:hypothetical protein